MISVVINTLNRTKELRDALTALKTQTFQDFEVVVVFGPFDEVSREMVEAHFPTVKMSSVPVANLSVSRNEGIRNSAGEWVAFLDDDGIPESDWLEELYKTAKNNSFDIVSGPLVDRTGLEYQALAVSSDIHGDSLIFKTSKEDLEFLAGANKLHNRYASVVGANFMIRREILEKINGYDEVIEYYLDETDLCLRADKVGARIGYSEFGTVHHKWRAGVVRGDNRVITNYWPILKNYCYFNFKHALDTSSLEAIRAKYAYFSGKCEQSILWAVENGLLETKFLGDFRVHQEFAWHHALFQHHSRNSENIKVELVCSAPFVKFTIRKPQSILISCKDATPAKSSGIGNLIRRTVTTLASYEFSIKLIFLDYELFARTGEAITYDDGVWWINAAGLPKPYEEEHIKQQQAFNDETENRMPHVGDYASRLTIWVRWIKEHTKLDAIFTQSWDVEGYYLAREGITFGTFAYTPARVVQGLCPNEDLRETLGLLWELEKFVLKKSQLVIFDSYFLKQDMSDINAIDSTVCYPGIAIKQQNRTYFGEKFFLYIGNLDPRKGIEWLARTWIKSIETSQHFNLVLVGVTLAEFENYLAVNGINAEKLPVCLGRVSDQELENLLSSCIAVLIPSKYESFGLPMIEAMSFGKGFVGSNNSAIKEVAELTSAGVLVPESNSDALLEVLTTYSKEQFQEMGNRGLIACENQFSFENSGLRLSQIIKKFIRS